MPFAFTDEQEEFRSGLRRYLAEHLPPSVVRAMMSTDLGWTRSGWQDVNAQFSLTGLHIPECYGGLGFGFVDLGIVLEEMGRALFCAPYFSSIVLAANAILNGGTEEQKRKLLPGIASGAVIAALASTEPDGEWTGHGVATTATERGGHFVLSGMKSFVLDGCGADLLIVLARRPGTQGDEGLSLFTVAADAPGVMRTPLKVLDATRKLASIKLDGVNGDLLGEQGAAAGPFAATMAQAAACLASEMVGGADALRELSLAYTKTRVQFGQPIAAFQSMKHRQADMLVDVELARSASCSANIMAQNDDDDFPAVASLAKACAADAYVRTAISAIQIHGGLGFSWENDTHLWFRRAKSSEVFLGDPSWHRERMLRAWGI